MNWFLQISALSVIFCKTRCQNHDFKNCPENMIFIPSDENLNDWICHCEESDLYFPATNSCHEAYKRGPCPPENYLIFPPGEKWEKCEKNPCLQDGLVLFEGSCAPIKNPFGNYLIKKLLRVHKFDLRSRFSRSTIKATNIVTAPVKPCPKGTRRDSSGICRPELGSQE
ncbi:uncharacterized protein LOC117173006 [Belonocnema kinseyi]|uniref:uncharacterized protein LOC117173006 n=1 Tax=Belonocnema kinseyi TaxID=2817044 RepID=UPI00143DA1DF|nr:uncharacterized protein LOC117173006 [Belonocnema kinseyi]